MRRYALHDEQWERIENLLPGKLSDVDVICDNRLLVCRGRPLSRPDRYPQRDLPERLNDSQIFHTRHMWGSRKGAWNLNSAIGV